MTAADPPFLSAAALLTHSVAVGTRLPAPVVGCATAPGEEEKAAAGTPPPSPPRTSPASSVSASAAPRAKRKAAQAGAPAHTHPLRKWSGKSAGDHAWYLAAEDTLAAGHPLDTRAAARHAALSAAFDAERAAWWAAAWAGAAAGWRGQAAKASEAVAAAHAAAHAAAVDARVRTLPPLWTCVAHVSLTAALHAAAAVPGAPPPARPLRGPARLPPLTLPRPGTTLDVAPSPGLTAGLAPPLPRDAAARELATRERAAAVVTGGALARLAGAGLAPPGGADPGWVLPLTLQTGVLYVDAPLPDAAGGDVRSACARAAKKALLVRGHGARPCPRSPYYSAWTAPDGGNGATIIVRTHVHGESGPVAGDTTTPRPTSVIVRCELRGAAPADAEEPHPASAAAAAVTAALRHGSSVVVAHVGVGGRVLRYSCAPRDGGAALARPLALLAAARAAAVAAGDGRYMWVRAPGADASALLRAGGGDGSERSGALPLATPLALGHTTDLHAAYSGPPPALAPAPPAPAAWRPASGGVAQVPHTWPPRSSGGKKQGAGSAKRRAGLPPPAARRGVAARPDLDAPRAGEVAGAGAAFAAGAGEGL